MSKIKVSVEKINGYCNLPLQVGDHFFVEDSKLVIPEGKFMCIWALQSMMPVFPLLAEKESISKDHWVRKLKTFSCPDPEGLVQFRFDTVD